MPVYDLQERTLRFAMDCREFIKSLEEKLHNIEYAKQLVRASGSQAANYIEANEALSARDFVHRIKICVKETKECALWIKLCDCGENPESLGQREALLRETGELRNIFGAILKKAKSKLGKNS